MSRRAARDPGDRWAEMAQDMAYRVGGLLREFVPAEAQLHLLNAQRELLTALILIYEHQAQARRAGSDRQQPVESRRERAPRLRRIDID